MLYLLRNLGKDRGQVTGAELHVPRSAEAFGLRVDTTGTHLSSTLKLKDLQVLLTAVHTSPAITMSDYKAAVIDQNVLAKPTANARRISYLRLRELYGLDPGLLIFRSLRDLWEADETAQPELALICSTARDPILRAITPYILEIPIGSQVTTQGISEEAETQFPGKFQPSSRDRLGRNAAASWRMAGLLSGKQKKYRTRLSGRPTSVAYALLLGDLCGRRGQRLFSTVWTSILSPSSHELTELAVAASQQGWIEYRASGDVVEVSFRHLTREK